MTTSPEGEPQNSIPIGRFRSVLNNLREKVHFIRGTNVEKHHDKFEGKYGLYTETGEPIFESPTLSQIQRIAGDPRIEYFPFQIPDGEVTRVVNDLGGVAILNDPKVLREGLVTLPLEDNRLLLLREGRGGTEKLFMRYIIDFLVLHMKKELGEKFLVGLRGTCCSVDGSINAGGLQVMDIKDVVQKGNERSHNEAPMTGFGDESNELHYRTQQYLVWSAQHLRRDLSEYPEQAAKIFPVLLVYDKSKMNMQEGGAYLKVTLPDSEEEASQAIIKAYVLDFPGQGY